MVIQEEETTEYGSEVKDDEVIFKATSSVEVIEENQRHLHLYYSKVATLEEEAAKATQELDTLWRMI